MARQKKPGDPLTTKVGSLTIIEQPSGMIGEASNLLDLDEIPTGPEAAINFSGSSQPEKLIVEQAELPEGLAEDFAADMQAGGLPSNLVPFEEWYQFIWVGGFAAGYRLSGSITPDRQPLETLNVSESDQQSRAAAKAVYEKAAKSEWFRWLVTMSEDMLSWLAIGQFGARIAIGCANELASRRAPGRPAKSPGGKPADVDMTKADPFS